VRNLEDAARARALTLATLLEVGEERDRQDAKWGEQNHKDGTGGRGSDVQAQALRKLCDERFAKGEGAWTDILMEEIAEAWAEEDPARLRAELIQVAAVAVAWVECIDRRAQARSMSPVAVGAEPEEQQRQGSDGDREATTAALSAASGDASRQDVSGASS
jgi:hypothetical protein